ncbi:hypothetical protein Q4493_02140 [Colwellia sp. 1_MG-2023]|uniref:hypothetical protein n=1 Tax=Colwellia sp. 1_MG-2023 TaxID=3062649 RepID=UPI0026E15364|nr:hypothetical protein [Colwellia sp. 1_MG-2023]MDO6444567.1 hypothetical protein [Colwellia sp. 1_MG-2023]
MKEIKSSLNIDKATQSPLTEQVDLTVTDEAHDNIVVDTNTSDETEILDEQWQSLTQDWQSQPVEKTDMQALLKQTKRRTAWAKTCFGLNVVATVGLFIAFVYGLFEDEFGTPWNTYLGGGAFMSLIFVYYEMKIRAKTWRQISDSPDQALENALAGCESSMKYMSLTKWSCIPFGVLANWFVYSVGSEGNKPMLAALIFINVFIAVMFLITELIHRKRKKEFKELNDKISNL